MDAPAVEQARDLLHLDERELRRGEHHHVDLVARPPRSLHRNAVEVGRADASGRRRGARPGRHRRSVGASGVTPGMWNMRDRAEARQRRAEMLELVGIRRALRGP